MGHKIRFKVVVIGSPDVFRLRQEPINSLPSVRPCVRPCVRAFRFYSLNRSIFFSDFFHEVVHPECLKYATFRFLSKIQNWSLFGQKWSKFGHFWPKLPFFGLFGLYLPNAAINFHNFLYGNKSCGVL